jgi:DNA-binding MarR family transcriptional regulator
MARVKPPESMDFLLANISHLHYTRAHQLLESIGLYRGQPPVLRALWEHEGFTQTELAERLRIRPATLTRMLQRMEKTGFIQRKADSVDQRVMRVYLSEAGRAIQGQVEGVWRKMEEETFANFSQEECAELHGFLRQMRENLLDATGEEPWG